MIDNKWNENYAQPPSPDGITNIDVIKLIQYPGVKMSDLIISKLLIKSAVSDTYSSVVGYSDLNRLI